MTTDFRAELQLLFDAADSFTEPVLGHHRPWAAAMDRARALLAQPEGEELADEELLELMPQQFRDDLATVSRLASHGTPVKPGIYRVTLNTGALDFARTAIAADRARRPTPQPPVLADTHYEWELQDDAGNKQAGGSANSLNDVRLEGARYLRAYAPDGPHKLIIRHHTTQTIDEMTNG